MKLLQLADICSMTDPLLGFPTSSLRITSDRAEALAP